MIPGVTPEREGAPAGAPPTSVLRRRLRTLLHPNAPAEGVTPHGHSGGGSGRTPRHIRGDRAIRDRWLGKRLVTRCIEIDAEAGLTMAQVQQLVDSLLPDVPVEQRAPAKSATDGARPELIVVDRDAFALELAGAASGFPLAGGDSLPAT